ncbi:MAG: thioredoxin-dependent thiol peroxidase [Nitrospirae bacterium]|nr:MAG: peroxiredoxin [Nitrospirae bacterium 13_2_20CM_2_62_8]OLC79982.1 MAG: peroxiredoxin [Nitrospirae bacterium 13_1_40CM_3_62_11]OLE41518.1 MAG: peroxiredoxin [Nitrospirae bacterium 13_1_20CM_2_62_14]TLY44755.1 MAG: thioredoxin-dependent thiol peroxidase [Nitrospirota bacterium]
MPAELAVGDKAPDFSLPDETGQPVSLKKFRGRQVVLYFYPKDDTPGCTKEACGFRDSMTPILKAGSAVVGVSLDGGESHRRFIAKHQLPFSLLSDEGARVAKAYGVYKEKTMYGRKFWGIERSTFVIDGTGTMKAVFRKVKVDGHVDEVLAVLSAPGK